MDDLNKLIKKHRKEIKGYDVKFAIENKRLAIALKIAELRMQEELTQSELAERLGTTQSVISRIEHGNQNITLDMLFKITHALNKKVELQIV